LIYWVGLPYKSGFDTPINFTTSCYDILQHLKSTKSSYLYAAANVISVILVSGVAITDESTPTIVNGIIVLLFPSDLKTLKCKWVKYAFQNAFNILIL
jgi:hypothetical protein